MNRRRAALRAAYLRSLRRQLAEARADVCDLVDALLPREAVLGADRYDLHERIEAEVRRHTPLPGLVGIGFARCIGWGRA